MKNYNIGNHIKALIIENGKTLTEINKKLNKVISSHCSTQSFSRKLKTETIKHKEVLAIANILGYEIIWQKKKNLR